SAGQRDFAFWQLIARAALMRGDRARGEPGVSDRPFATTRAVRSVVRLQIIKKPLRDLLRFFFSSRRRHTRLVSDWSSDVCSSDLIRCCWTASSSTCSTRSPDGGGGAIGAGECATRGGARSAPAPPSLTASARAATSDRKSVV